MIAVETQSEANALAIATVQATQASMVAFKATATMVMSAHTDFQRAIATAVMKASYTPNVPTPVAP